jgi:hypothetical protein
MSFLKIIKYPLVRTIFLSYNHPDKAAVETLKTALESIDKNITCWYDKEDIRTGAGYDKLISDNIQNANLFIPLISANSLAHNTGYVAKEWNWAEQENMKRQKDSYALPIIIDDTTSINPVIPQWLKNISIGTAPGGKPGDDFLIQVKKMLKL